MHDQAMKMPTPGPSLLGAMEELSETIARMDAELSGIERAAARLKRREVTPGKDPAEPGVTTQSFEDNLKDQTRRLRSLVTFADDIREHLERTI
jgi:hypothetical protein